MTEPRKTITDMRDSAWGIIANAGGGDWDKESPEWKAAAERWRDTYLNALPDSGLDVERLGRAIGRLLPPNELPPYWLKPDKVAAAYARQPEPVGMAGLDLPDSLDFDTSHRARQPEPVSHGRPNYYECTVPGCTLDGHKPRQPEPGEDR